MTWAGAAELLEPKLRFCKDDDRDDCNDDFNDEVGFAVGGAEVGCDAAWFVEVEGFEGGGSCESTGWEEDWVIGGTQAFIDGRREDIIGS